MINAKKFKEVFGVNPDTEIMILECPLRMETCQWRYGNACHCEDWWTAEYQEPKTKNDLGDDRKDAVERLNAIKQLIGYDKDSEIVKATQKSLDLAVQALEQEPRKGHWIIDTHKIRAFGKKNETHDYSVHCDKCNYAWDYTTDEEGSLVSNFCPNCGADMRGEEE